MPFGQYNDDPILGHQLVGQGSMGRGSQGSINNVYNAAASQQAQDYDDIMGGYDSLQNRGSRDYSPLNYTAVNPVFNRQLQTNQYNRSNDLNTTITGLQDYANTGGYSEADKSNLRARGTNTIRSIYDSAQRGVNRQRSLQGGYSPNQGALIAKMARESAGQIGDITSRVNADIAERVAAGKLSGLSQLSAATGRENELINENDQRNIDAFNKNELWNTNEQNRINELNIREQLRVNELNDRNTREYNQQNYNNELNAVSGKQSLYGTTPGLTSTFANQALMNNQQQMQAVQTANMLKNQRANIGLNLVQNQLGGRT